MLLPILDQLPLDAALSGWADPPGNTAASLIRLLLLAKCLGGGHAQGVLNDTVWRDLTGVAPGTSSEVVAAWLREQPRGHWIALMKHAYESRPVHPETSRHRLPDGPLGNPVEVLVDGDGYWIYVAPAAEGEEAGNPESLLPFLPGGALPQQGGTGESERLGADLNHLSLPVAVCPCAEADLALSAVAQQVMHGLARRLPGFGTSGMGHLADNFLDVFARFDEEPERNVVRLGRPPLNVVLAMSGLSRARFSISWVKRPFQLFMEG